MMYTGIFISFNSRSFCATNTSASIAGSAVLNKSPANRIKSTFSSTHISIARAKTARLTFLMRSSRQLPICKSERCAYFMEIAQKKDYKCIVIAEYTVSILYRNKAKNEYPYVLNQLMGHA